MNSNMFVSRYLTRDDCLYTEAVLGGRGWWVGGQGEYSKVDDLTKPYV